MNSVQLTLIHHNLQPFVSDAHRRDCSLSAAVRQKLVAAAVFGGVTLSTYR
jgi:hypothetical protein